LKKHGDKMLFKDNPFDLPFEVFKNIFKETNLTDVQFCGNKGDAIFHPDFHKILNYTIDQGVFVSLSTNGSSFSKDWWYELGKRMRGEVTFALDGLEDTHGIYRATSFKKVYENMVSFIEGGGSSTWQYIVFRHNEHQLDEAKRLSKEIGCYKFITVISRFYDEVMQRPTTINMTSTKREIFRKLSPYPKLKRVMFGEIKCQWATRLKRVYVSSRGNVYNCCYLCCFTQDWHTHPEFMPIKSKMKQPEYNIANNTLNKIIKLPLMTYIYDNVDKYKMCDLNCSNLDMYRSKIRREENL